jgi:3-oxosteroid 1-dehydrogenase
MTDWTYATDLVVVGSGGGGMTAALAAKAQGGDTIIFEKTEYYGGSTALSGGYVWVPDNYVMAEADLPDSIEDARIYLYGLIADRVPKTRIEAYIHGSRDMLAFLKEQTQVEFMLTPGYTDYYPEHPGGTLGGRGIEPVPFDGRKLNEDLKYLRPSIFEAPFGIVLTSKEYRQVGMFTSTWEGKTTAVKLGLRAVVNSILGVKYLTMGQALAARLKYSLKEANVPLWLNTPVRSLTLDNGRVTGVSAEKNGKVIAIRARKGVLLAAGGFPHNLEMRLMYQEQPITTDWTLASPGNTGDAIQMGMELGADIDLMEDAWWGPISLPPDNGPFFHVAERAYPGGIIVASDGKRFMNESLPYVEAVHEVYRHNRNRVKTIPAYFVMDQRFRDKYIFKTLFPLQPMPQKFLKSGYVKKAETLPQLAELCSIDPTGLVETVREFNKFARIGVDEQFKRGESAYDRYYGDPSIKPNPNLAPIEKPPFYAVAMYPGDIGTKGGLVTDEHARVLKKSGEVIPGLYATGNSSASVMGNTYPGPGGTIGPSMTFGYLAALEALKDE